MASFRETVNITLLVMDSTWSEQNFATNNHINSNSRFLCRHFLFIIYTFWARCVCKGRRRRGKFFPSVMYNMLSNFSLFAVKLWKEKQWLNLPLPIEWLIFPEKMSLRPPNVERPEKQSQNPKWVMALTKDSLVPYCMNMIPTW